MVTKGAELPYDEHYSPQVFESFESYDRASTDFYHRLNKWGQSPFMSVAGGFAARTATVPIHNGNKR